MADKRKEIKGVFEYRNADTSLRVSIFKNNWADILDVTVTDGVTTVTESAASIRAAAAGKYVDPILSVNTTTLTNGAWDITLEFGDGKDKQTFLVNKVIDTGNPLRFTFSNALDIDQSYTPETF